MKIYKKNFFIEKKYLAVSHSHCHHHHINDDDDDDGIWFACFVAWLVDWLAEHDLNLKNHFFHSFILIQTWFILFSFLLSCFFFFKEFVDMVFLDSFFLSEEMCKKNKIHHSFIQ